MAKKNGKEDFSTEPTLGEVFCMAIVTGAYFTIPIIILFAIFGCKPGSV
jgi:hypothetical protein